MLCQYARGAACSKDVCLLMCSHTNKKHQGRQERKSTDRDRRTDKRTTRQTARQRDSYTTIQPTETDTETDSTSRTASTDTDRTPEAPKHGWPRSVCEHIAAHAHGQSAMTTYYREVWRLRARSPSLSTPFWKRQHQIASGHAVSCFRGVTQQQATRHDTTQHDRIRIR